MDDLKSKHESAILEVEKRLPDNEPVSAVNAPTSAIRVKNKKKHKSRNEVEI